MRRPAASPAVLPLLLVLAACKPATTPAQGEILEAEPKPATSIGIAAEPKATCPDADFAAFLKRFESSAEVQRTSTADPLAMDSIDSDAMPEPKRVTKQVALADVEFPVLFGPSQREAEGLQETVTELGPSEREVTHGIPDSDAQVRFNFRADPCWKLVRLSDDAI